MNAALNKIGIGIDVVSLTVALADVYSILSICLLVLSIISILWRAGYTIYTHIKNKQYDKVGEELDKAVKDINDKLDKGGDTNGKN